MNPGIPEEIQKARENEADMNLLIEKNKKFIITSAYRAVNHYVTESDDEWSIALIAFALFSPPIRMIAKPRIRA